jgi:hypothetical protein
MGDGGTAEHTSTAVVVSSRCDLAAVHFIHIAAHNGMLNSYGTLALEGMLEHEAHCSTLAN